MPVEIKYEIVEKIAVLSESSKGWTKELNLIKWNDREPKYDISVSFAVSYTGLSLPSF